MERSTGLRKATARQVPNASTGVPHGIFDAQRLTHRTDKLLNAGQEMLFVGKSGAHFGWDAHRAAGLPVYRAPQRTSFC